MVQEQEGQCRAVHLTEVKNRVFQVLSLHNKLSQDSTAIKNNAFIVPVDSKSQEFGPGVVKMVYRYFTMSES